MQHKVSKIRIAGGRDGNKMLVTKLVRNFVAHGYITTTLTKANLLKSVLEMLAHDAQGYNEAVKNTLLGYLGTLKMVNIFVDLVKVHAKNGVSSGIVRVVKLGSRPGDAASVGKVVWTHDVAISSASKKEVQPKVK